VLTPIEASLLVLGLCLLSVGGIRSLLAALPPEAPLPWALRSHLPPLLMLLGTVLLARRFPKARARLWCGRRTALFAGSAACLGAAGGLLIGPSDPQGLAPALSAGGALAWGLCWVGVLAPLIEESFYRGALQTALAQRMPSALAVLLAGAAFMLSHLGQSPLWLYLALGCGLGAYAAMSGALLPAVAGHIAWNVATVALSATARPLALVPYALVGLGLLGLQGALACRGRDGGA
jgi:membrane protease YdiL (CAAX protease family)